ncbi:leishmanolysin [Alsobacter sp. SYSU M60028]|uniref:Leishmanolysin n=1 Tax=Alsobacter ponti TaxID=2962936 RepID=A0ABT1LHC2_9HYPH|nr:leishmanolysin [Alsobacter ponti]MCP8940906.1 leishmanolysin [Alsobacter ponti]
MTRTRDGLTLGDDNRADFWLEAAPAAQEHAGPVLLDHEIFVFPTGDAAKTGGGGSGGGGSTSGGATTFQDYTTGAADTVADSLQFNITLDFVGSFTQKQHDLIVWAANTWSTWITGDVHDDFYQDNTTPIDDLVIHVSAGRIDGTGSPILGNILAQTTINTVRTYSDYSYYLPVESTMKLDSTDLANSAKNGFNGTWDTIILHEMGHALGFAGPIFTAKALLDAAGNFSGASAVQAYGGAVPIETAGGTGTAGSHWSETAFAPGGVAMSNELMTGYIGAGEKTYLSDTTLAAFHDMGYTVSDPNLATASILIDSGLLAV